MLCKTKHSLLNNSALHWLKIQLGIQYLFIIINIYLYTILNKDTYINKLTLYKINS